MVTVRPDVRLLIRADAVRLGDVVVVEVVPVRYDRDNFGARRVQKIWYLPSDPLNYLAGLRIAAEVNFAADGQLYGYRVEYSAVASIGLERAETMTKALRKIQRSLARATESRGQPNSFAEYLARVAAALRINL